MSNPIVPTGQDNTLTKNTILPDSKSYPRPVRRISKDYLIATLYEVANSLEVSARRTPWWRPLERYRLRILADYNRRIAFDIKHGVLDDR